MSKRQERPFLEIRDLTLSYDDGRVVDDVSLSVAGCGITALVGPSGCGKTSLLRSIAGFESPQAGSIRIDGTEVFGPRCWVDPERRRLGMVFQEGALFPHLTVRDNVAYGIRAGHGAGARTAEVLELVGMTALAGRYPDQLSGGQQQLVAVARALAPDPLAVLLDEPFASLDADLRGRLRDEVREILRAAEVPAILVTHDQEEALSMADRVAVMFRGRLLQTGTADEIYHRPTTPEVARFIGGGQLVDCEVRGGRVRSIFGSLSTEAPDGRGQLLIRPEDLRINAGGPVSGEVERRNFYGHDVLDEVRVDSGILVRVREIGTAVEHAVGARVTLELREKAYRLFLTAGGERLVGQAIRLIH